MAEPVDDAATGEPYPFQTVYTDGNIVFEEDDDGVVMLSWGRKSSLWMGFRNPFNPLEFGLEYFQTQVCWAWERPWHGTCCATRPSTFLFNTVHKVFGGNAWATAYLDISASPHRCTSLSSHPIDHRD